MIFRTPLVFFVGSSLPMWKFILCLSSFKPETASENLVKSELQVFIQNPSNLENKNLTFLCFETGLSYPRLYVDQAILEPIDCYIPLTPECWN